MTTSYGAGANTIPGNEGPLKIHRSGTDYLLKLKMNHVLYNMIQHKDKDVLDAIRIIMYENPEFNSSKWKSATDKVKFLKEIADQLIAVHAMPTPLLKPFKNEPEKKTPIFSKVYEKYKSLPNVGEFILVKWSGEWGLSFTTEDANDELCCVAMETGTLYRFHQESSTIEWKYPEKVILEAY